MERREVRSPWINSVRIPRPCRGAGMLSTLRIPHSKVRSPANRSILNIVAQDNPYDATRFSATTINHFIEDQHRSDKTHHD
jgi:hypothetical protein